MYYLHPSVCMLPPSRRKLGKRFRRQVRSFLSDFPPHRVMQSLHKLVMCRLTGAHEHEPPDEQLLEDMRALFDFLDQARCQRKKWKPRALVVPMEGAHVPTPGGMRG